MKLNGFRAILTGIVVSVSAAGVGAQPANRSFSSYFFFGDSLTDNGNLFALTGSPPPPYFQGRVSNGITYAEYLKPGLQAVLLTASSVRTNLNFAFAGATAAPGSAVPNLGLQLATFQSRGIAPGANDIFVILAGANDILNAISTPATQNHLGVEAAARNASAAVTSTVGSLFGAGAKNIVVINLPDISRTARFTTGTGRPAATLAQHGSNQFNSDIRGRLGGMSVPSDARLQLVDLEKIFNGLIANAARFGFSITDQEWVGILLSGGNPGDVNNYIFFDGIHPTTKTHAVFASSISEIINPERVLATATPQALSGLLMADLAADTVQDRLVSTNPSARGNRTDAFFSYTRKEGGMDFAGYRWGFDYEASVLTAGVDTMLNDKILVGGAFTSEKMDVDLLAGAGGYDLSGYGTTAFVSMTTGAWTIDATASYSNFALRNISRTTAFGGFATNATTDGWRQAASVSLRTSMSIGSAELKPMAGIRYALVNVEAYNEQGVDALNFKYDDSDAGILAGVVGASLSVPLSSGRLPTFLAIDGYYQTDLESGDRNLTGKNADMIAGRALITVADAYDDSIKVGARLGGAFMRKWNWMAGYSAEFRNDGDTASRYFLSMNTGY